MMSDQIERSRYGGPCLAYSLRCFRDSNGRLPGARACPDETRRKRGSAITVLYDAFGKSGAMKQDWGYAAFIEFAGKRILFDSGNDPAVLAGNTNANHVDLSALDLHIPATSPGRITKRICAVFKRMRSSRAWRSEVRHGRVHHYCKDWSSAESVAAE
jgi:hypothetical protein